MSMLGSEGFEFDGDEYTVTLKFDDDGTYDGVDGIAAVRYGTVADTGIGAHVAEIVVTNLGHNEATAIWWSLTEQQRDVLHQRCLEDAQLSRQSEDNDSVWAAF